MRKTRHERQNDLAQAREDLRQMEYTAARFPGLDEASREYVRQLLRRKRAQVALLALGLLGRKR